MAKLSTTELRLIARKMKFYFDKEIEAYNDGLKNSKEYKSEIAKFKISDLNQDLEKLIAMNKEYEKLGNQIQHFISKIKTSHPEVKKYGYYHSPGSYPKDDFYLEKHLNSVFKDKQKAFLTEDQILTELLLNNTGKDFDFDGMMDALRKTFSI